MDRLICRYPVASLVGDYLRSAIGLALTLLPGSQLPAGTPGFIVLMAFAGLFIGLALLTLRRQITRIVMTSEAIESLPWGRAIRWEAIKEAKLSYFCTNPDQKNGWMQLTVKSGTQALRVDSRIEHFQAIAARVHERTGDLSVELSAASKSNFQALSERTFRS